MLMKVTGIFSWTSETVLVLKILPASMLGPSGFSHVRCENAVPPGFSAQWSAAALVLKRVRWFCSHGNPVGAYKSGFYNSGTASDAVSDAHDGKPVRMTAFYRAIIALFYMIWLLVAVGSA